MDSDSDSDSGSDGGSGGALLSPELLAELRPEALAALREVMAARAAADTEEDGGPATGAAAATAAGVSEDWRKSQVWVCGCCPRVARPADTLRGPDCVGLH